MFFALRGRVSSGNVTTEQYFLSSRNLRWPSIALSTIATNVQGYQFLGMMGSAYLYGLAQANLEINAMQGILLAAFVFVPFYLRERIITITQFIESKLGPRIAFFYTLANIALFSTITLGAALFWGAYAADLVFGDYISVISDNRATRLSFLIIGLGVFSAIYTYLGGLSAVVKTDVIQFAILLIGGLIVLLVSINALGGWSALYSKAESHMHLHLPAEHEKLPWTHMFGLFFLNINYWCANQTVMQRSLAAKSLKEAQIGLLAGGVLKYLMAIVIVVPGIALYALLQETGSPLSDPDQAFPYLVNTHLPTGLKGLVLCALFASLMSTVDSTFNSIATLFSVDIYKKYLNPQATDLQVVGTGKKVILFCLLTGIVMGLVLMYIKLNSTESSFTHTLNELRYYINCGIVVLICSAILLITPNREATLLAFLITVPLQFVFKDYYPDMNYFVRAGCVISIALMVSLVFGFQGGYRKSLFFSESRAVAITGIILFLSLVLLHFIFH